MNVNGYDILPYANLTGADLRCADLRCANLRGANLRGANLRGANLRSANLRGADLYRANLQGADLAGANLRGANLTEATLRYVNLHGTNLQGAVGAKHLPIDDPRGYRCAAVAHADGWRIAAGCRWFTLDEAEAHWGSGYKGDRTIGNAYLAAVKGLRDLPNGEMGV